MKRDDLVWVCLAALLTLVVSVGGVFVLRIAGGPGWLIPGAADKGPARPDQIKKMPTDHEGYHPDGATE